MSDHCLALMKAADDIFPLADKRLCTWHIIEQTQNKLPKDVHEGQ